MGRSPKKKKFSLSSSPTIRGSVSKNSDNISEAEVEAALEAMPPDQDWRSRTGTGDDWRNDMRLALAAISEAEVEAALDAMLPDKNWRSRGREADDWRYDMRLALTAAERARSIVAKADAALAAAEEAKNEVSQAKEARTQPDQPIPDEAAEAGAKAIWAIESPMEWDALYAKEHRKNEARDKAKSVIEAAAPAIRAQTLAEAKARVAAERLTDNTGQADDLAYNRAINDSVTAIDNDLYNKAKEMYESEPGNKDKKFEDLVTKSDQDWWIEEAKTEMF